MSTPGSSDDPLEGTLLAGRYRLEQPIGAGGMAQVWEATDEVLGRKVAVKLLHPHLAADEAFVRRFQQEAMAAARLSHPSIVAVFDTVSDQRHQAIVMELLDATTLRRLLDEQAPLDADTTVRISVRLLDALEHAHANGVVHRDVKPSNILLCRDGRVKIADFGIAKADDQTELTREGALVGTATYLAPEQLTNERVTGRADLYSLAIVMYECLTGQVPFRGDTGAATALARLHSDPVDPRRLRADVPASVAGPVMRALQRDPSDRFDGAADFRAALVQPGTRASTHDLVLPDRGHDDYDNEPTVESESFTRSERNWLLPAMVIVLLAGAVVVAGLLLRQTTTDPAGTATTATTANSDGTLRIASVSTFDPRGTGTPGENNPLATQAVDQDPATSWETERYGRRTFGNDKTGVGLVLDLAGRASVDTVRVASSDNGWSADIFVLAEGEIGGFDPDGAAPTATVADVRGPVDIATNGAKGSTVLIWITDLGEPDTGGGHQVSLSEVAVLGRGAGA